MEIFHWVEIPTQTPTSLKSNFFRWYFTISQYLHHTHNHKPLLKMIFEMKYSFAIFPWIEISVKYSQPPTPLKVFSLLYFDIHWKTISHNIWPILATTTKPFLKTCSFFWQIFAQCPLIDQWKIIFSEISMYFWQMSIDKWWLGQNRELRGLNIVRL